MITPATSSTNCPILIPTGWFIIPYNFIFFIIYFNNNFFFDANNAICFLINLKAILKIQLRNNDKFYTCPLQINNFAGLLVLTLHFH